MLRPVEFSATGMVTAGGQAGAGSVQVSGEGMTIGMPSGATLARQAWEIRTVRRQAYAITAEFTGGDPVTFEQFARRTDDLEGALWRCRCDALAELMAPASETALEAIEASGTMTGWLYRYQDGLRWVPRAGSCFARLYGELQGAQFEPGSYTVGMWGPFGHDRVQGLARRTTETEQEIRRRVAEAKNEFHNHLQGAGLSWRDDIWTGSVRPHVPFAANEARLRAVESAPGLIAEERKEYWDSLREDGLIARLVIGSDDQDQLRLVALCPVASGELYEVMSEGDHASFVFRKADPVVRAWTEVGFRREPLFEQEAEEGGPYQALAEVLPSLATARASLVKRVVHDSVDQWRAALGDATP